MKPIDLKKDFANILLNIFMDRHEFSFTIIALYVWKDTLR